MSNSTIATRILEVIAAFERGEVGPSRVVESIELHEPALESIPREVRDQLRQLSVQILYQDISRREEEMLGWKASREALEQLKAILGSL